ncbi:MAG: glycosyltransferase family 39 protein [Gaiellaceae bacterium]
MVIARLAALGARSAVSRSVRTALMLGAWSAAGALALFATFYGLTTRYWLVDERIYRRAGRLYVEQHQFGFNAEHPPLGKYLIGLSQLAFGHAEFGTRLPSALATLVTGILLALLVARAVGQVPALVTFVAWTLLPHPGRVDEISRLAYLDTIMVAFLAFALYATWRWWESSSWKWTIALGAGWGLAVATKVSALFVVPALAVLLFRKDGLGRRAAQLGAAAVTGCAVFLATYIPFGWHTAKWAIGYMVGFEYDHAQRGHRVLLAGHFYRFPPWWAQADWLWHDSHATTIAMAVSLVLAPFLVPRRISVFLLAAVLAPAAVFAFATQILLSHWMYDWMPAMAALIGIAIGAALTSTSWKYRFVGVALAVILALLVGSYIRSIVDLRPTGYRTIESELATVDHPGNVVLKCGGPDSPAYDLSSYFFFARVAHRTPVDTTQVAAVVVATNWPSPYAHGAMPPVVASHPAAFRRWSHPGFIVWFRRD